MSLRYSDQSIHDLLLEKANKDSIQCLEQAPQWIQELALAFTDDLGLLSLHGPRGLSEQLPQESPVRIPLCAADNTLMLLARNALQSKQHVGIAFPPGAVMMPMLLVCKTLLGDLLNQQTALEDGAPQIGVKQKGGILLVSPDAEVRARYFSMRVGPESVVATYPACRMRPDGTVVPVVAKQTGLPPESFTVCFFLAHQKKMPSAEEVAFKPSVVLLDFTHDRWIERRQQMLEWCLHLRDRLGEPATVITLIPFGDARSREALEKYQVPVFPMDGTFISELADGFQPIKPVTKELFQEAYRSWSFSAFTLERPLERSHRLYFVPDESAFATIETVEHIYSSLNAVNDREFGRELRLATWLVGTLVQLPVPVQWYEQHAYLMGNRQTLKKLISTIGNSGQGTMSAHLAPTLQALRGQLDLLYMRLSDANPKSISFLKYYREQLQPLLEEGKKVAIVCRNDVVARALWPWMQSEGVTTEHQAKLHILTFKQIDGRTLFDHMLSTGPWPTRYRWQLGGRLARAVDLLFYRGEEIIVEKQLRNFYGARAKMYFKNRRNSLLQKWTIITEEADRVSALNTMNDSLLLDVAQESRSETLPRPIVWDSEPAPFDFDEDEADVKSLFEVVATNWQEAPPGTLRTVEENTGVQARSLPLPEAGSWYDEADPPEADELEEILPADGPTEACLRLKIQKTFSGQKELPNDIHYLYLSGEGTTECFIPTQQDEGLTTVDNDEIEPGFILLRTDYDDRRGLFERIVQLADAQPTMKYLAVWRQHWREAIDSLAGSRHSSGRARRGTYQALRAQLALAGVRVALVTVRTWVLGQTIGPGNLASIKAVGALSKHSMVEQYPEQIDAAFKQIRAIHQALGRRINRVLERVGNASQRQGKRSTRTSQEVQLDPALSVPIDDLIDMLQFWEVTEVSVGPWQVPVGRVNSVLSRPLYGGE
jgi:hypothetical protein